MRLAWSALWVLLSLGPALAAQVEIFSPQGAVKDVRQVAVRFSEAMVEFGHPRLPDPFDIDCVEPGTGRWADQKNWIYDFSRDLPAGVRCVFAVKPGLQSLAGAAIEAAVSYEITTGGPAIRESLPFEGAMIDEEQVFILALDAPASAASVAAHAYCDVRGIAERIELREVEGEERAAVLEARRDYLQRLLDVPSTGERPSVAERLTMLHVVQCKRRLPNNAELRLVWGQGVSTPDGVATSQERGLSFRVRDGFQARFLCERANKEADCLPMLPMRLAFTAPVSREQAQRIVLKPKAGKAIAALPGRARDHAAYIDEVHFPVPLPERAQFTVELPAGLVDDAGRKLVNQKRFPLTVRTGDYPPLAKFPARFGIIELHGDGVLPVTLRNLEAEVAARMASTARQGDPEAQAADKAEAAINWLKNKIDESRHKEAGDVPGGYSRVAEGDVMKIIDWMKRLRQLESDRWRYDESRKESVLEYRTGEASIFNERDRVRRLDVRRPQGPRAFEVVGIPLRKPGFYVVELASPRLGAALLDTPKKPYYVQSAALVTNLAVHWKWGREGSLAWVTALDTGKPVPEARVVVQDCSGKVYYRGTTDAQGRARVALALPEPQRLPPCLSAHDRQLVVSASHGEDLSLVMSEWNEGIARWRYNLRDAAWDGPFLVSTVFDRSLLRAGETVGMKHYYRRHDTKGFSFVPADALPGKLVIEHQGSGEKYELPVAWDHRNSAETAWKVPEGARKGTYAVTMTDTLQGRTGAGGTTRTSGTFRVEEFRVPLMKAEIAGPQGAQVNPSSVELDLRLRYLSGGGAGHADVRVRSVLRPKAVDFPDFDGFFFANGKVVEGSERQPAPRWALEASGPGGESEGEPTADGMLMLKTFALALDASGSARVTVPGLPPSDRPRELNAEFQYADPNGEMLTTSTRVALWPSAIVLGIKPDSWAASAEALRFQVLALDLAGKPVSGQRVQTQLYVREAYSHRKRLVGGFYGYENGADVRKVEGLCEGLTDKSGRLSCTLKPPVSGNILIGAEARDRAGNPSFAQASAWVAGKEAWWFDQADDDRIDVIPERKRYEPGETAVLQVRMPFREATALVTVEREGVVESFVHSLSGDAPVVRVPIKGAHAPNVFVSVLVVRGRVAGVQPTALVDLGKPAFKMGVAEISVGWRAHELAVKVSADKDTYRVREKARIRLQVTQRAGGKPPKAGEVAIAVVDEGLLELGSNESWKLLEAMMRPRGIEVDTSTAAMQVVGKRHYGRKSLPHGGGGGRGATRELFDTLLLWKGRVVLDKNGRASVDVPLNDSLTAFRIIAVADAGNGHFGTGQATIRATQDIMLLSGLPPLVREGDRFEARYTVRNASARAIQVVVNGNVEGQALPAMRLPLAAGEARDARWEVNVPGNVTRLRWDVAATELDGAQAQADRLKVIQEVVPAVPVRTVQGTLAQLEHPFSLEVKLPPDALPGRGGVRLTLVPNLAAGLAGVREFMVAYPYTCLEQRSSQAIALRDSVLWEKVMNDLPAYLDREGFAKYFAAQAEGSDTLTAYLLAIAREGGWDLPEGPRARMLEALRLFVSGRARRDSPLPSADLTIRKLAALDALSRYGAVERNLLDSIEVAPNTWPTSAVLDWHGVLKRSEGLADRERRMSEAGQILRSRLNFQGTVLGFSTARLDQLWWLMVSGDANASRVLLAFLDSPGWREDLPRLVRGALGRQQLGHWDTTVANAWGVLAMEKFSAAFEAEPVTGEASASLESQRGQVRWADAPNGGALDFTWPAGSAALSVRPEGSGRPWLTVQSRAAIPLEAPWSAGYRIERTVTPVETSGAGALRRGDTVRVRLDIEAQSDMAWVVVDDPVPAGAAILGGGLGRDSQILSAGQVPRSLVQPAFEERSFAGFRAYYRFVPKGHWSVEYTLRLNNPGTFGLPPTRVEAMYAPEMFGERPNAAITVAP